MRITDEEMWIIPVITKESKIVYVITMDSSQQQARERAIKWAKGEPEVIEVGEPKTPYHVL